MAETVPIIQASEQVVQGFQIDSNTIARYDYNSLANIPESTDQTDNNYIILIDQKTNNKYQIYVEEGVLKMALITNQEEQQ